MRPEKNGCPPKPLILVSREVQPYACSNRGRCCEDVLTFDAFVRLMRDALVRHSGSAHKLFPELDGRGAEPVDRSNFYRELARTPVAVGRALRRVGSAKPATLMPAGPAARPLPACFDAFAVVVGDGTKIKETAKRPAPTRGHAGRPIGAKALVAVDPRTGWRGVRVGGFQRLRNAAGITSRFQVAAAGIAR